MIARPQFKPEVHVEIVKDEGVFLLSEVGRAVLTGRLFEVVAPLIDGRRSPDDIADGLDGEVSAAHVYYALRLLEQRGYLCESVTNRATRDAVFWSVHNVAPDTAAARLADATVSLSAFGVEIESFLPSLESVHVRVADEGVLGIVLAADYLCAGLADYNREALRTGRAWMLFKPVGATILIGPTFVPGQSACWHCLAQRLRINRSVEMFVQRKQRRDEPFPVPPATTPAARQIAYGMAATEIARWIARGGTPATDGGILSLDVVSWRTDRHRVMRQPQCPACGTPTSIASHPGTEVRLTSRKKVFVEDGGHRAITPDETLRKYAHHVSPITGAVHGLARHVTSDDHAMHIYVAGDNHAAPHYDLQHIRWSLRGGSGGKGITDSQARASALCEALERYSGVFQGTEPRRTATFTQLNGLAIHPNDCMRFSERQYQCRERINAQGSRFSYVPLAFDEDIEIEWSPVWSLTHDVFRYLPTDYCYYSYPAPSHRRYCVGCSNGNAAGNTTEEAILQGFLELVERDAVALWWYNRTRRPAIALGSFDEPYIGKLTAFLRARGRDLRVLDVTSDLTIPVCVAVSRRTNEPQEHIMLGFGAHLDPRIAVLRALAELTQSLTWVLDGNGAGAERTVAIDDPEFLRWLTHATVANQPYLVPDEGVPPRPASTFPARWSEDLKDDVLFCEDLIAQRGMELLVLDQTRPDIGLPVVKVIVPGLRHFWPRFAPGRLYDVPAALGWVPEPVAEERLNPIALFI